MNQKILYSQKYKKPGARIKKQSLPVLNHVTNGFRCIDAYLLEAGKLSDGNEYQIIKVIIND